jgi:hypothetical protein
MTPQNKYACLVEVPGEVNAHGWQETVGRRAIIDTRRETHARGIGAKGTVRVQQRGSVRWKILYQCVVKKDGRLSRRGVEL